MKNEKKFTLICASLVLVITGIIAWLAPIAFCAYRTCDKSTAFWLALSNSAGKIGTPVIILTAGALLALGRKTFGQKLATFFTFVLTASLALGAVAYVNEHVTKPMLKLPRPSHKYLQKKGVIAIGLPAFYEKNKEERQRYLRREIFKQQKKLSGIHPRVLDHWALEAGFSFPSGHSLNAFALGVVFCYFLCCKVRSKARYLLCSLPLLWSSAVCLSRVALGVHTALDVSTGATLGLILTALPISGGFFDRFVKSCLSADAVNLLNR